jgi:hypothetical protein
VLASDAVAVGRLGVEVFGAGTEERTPEMVTRRAAHYLTGAHPSSAVAETPSGELIAAAVTRQLGPVVFLAWAVVREAYQGQGLMKAMLAGFPTREESTQRVILASTDPKAMRRYSALGLALHPAVAAAGILRPGAVQPPAEAIECSVPEAASVLEPIAMDVRRSTYGRDQELMDAQGDRAHLIGSSGVAIRRGGVIRALVARDERSAARALRAALAAVPPGNTVHLGPLRAGQDWAVREALAAGLALSPEGPVFSDHPLSPFHIPNGSMF